MIIVIFSSAKNDAAKQLLKEIQNRFGDRRIEIATTVKAFGEWFHRPMIERLILILMPENQEQLEELISLGDVMDDNPILFVLPNREPLTVSIGHKLYPRFVSYLDSDFSYLAAVLHRMLRNIEGATGFNERKC
jgi:hypothetical protein